MRKIIIVLLFATLVICRAYAQNNLPPVFEIQSDTSSFTALPVQYWQVIEDPDGKLNFSEISKTPWVNRFQSPSENTLQHNNKVRGYWFRYRLKNVREQVSKIWLGDNYYSTSPFFGPFDEQSDYYLMQQDGKAMHYRNSFLGPWSQLDGIKDYRMIPLELKPGEELIVYQQLYNSYKFGLSPQVGKFLLGFGSTEKAMQQIHQRDDSEFNVEIKTDFESGLKEIPIVRQDIGRVLLNIYNNAFYAINERRKREGDNFQPNVTTSTKLNGTGISIIIADNGGGIPGKIRDKIFQPFFTTKPAGTGVGLGLSQSYEVITKGHRGEIRAESLDGETQIIIQLPIEQ